MCQNLEKLVFLDSFFQTEHLKMFGAKEFGFGEYENLLSEAYGTEAEF